MGDLSNSTVCFDECALALEECERSERIFHEKLLKCSVGNESKNSLSDVMTELVENGKDQVSSSAFHRYLDKKYFITLPLAEGSGDLDPQFLAEEEATIGDVESISDRFFAIDVSRAEKMLFRKMVFMFGDSQFGLLVYQALLIMVAIIVAFGTVGFLVYFIKRRLRTTNNVDLEEIITEPNVSFLVVK